MKEWKKEDIKKLFPLTCNITQDIIDSKESIGDILLKNHLPKELHEQIFWGLSIGNIGPVLIKVEQTVEYNGKKETIPFYLQRSDIKEPITITFEIRTK